MGCMADFRAILDESPAFKALANEDTLLRTHCCRHKCFPVCPRAQHLLRTQILCPGHKKCVRNKCFPVSAAQETSWATLCPQQCVLIYQGLKEHDYQPQHTEWCSLRHFLSGTIAVIQVASTNLPLIIYES